MARREDAADKHGKRSPLAGWFARRSAMTEPEPAPAIDVARGLHRALRATSQNAPTANADAGEAICEALGAIEGALYAIDGVRDALEQASEVAASAQAAEEESARALLAERYDELRLSIDEALDRVDPRAAALVGSSRRALDVALDGRARYAVSPVSLFIRDDGLILRPPHAGFSDDREIAAVAEEIDRALTKADNAAATYCRDAKFLMDRLAAVKPDAAA